jgi:hypothetical protein
VHLVLVLRESATPADLEAIAGGMFARWSRGLQAAGLDSPLRIGQDWHLVSGERASDDLGGYLAKLADSAEPASDGLGLELTHGLAGRAAAGMATRPTWALLDHLVRTGEAGALQLWHEWERVSKGKRQVGWSKGLRERFAPEVEELTDDAIVDQEVGSDADDLVRWTADQWRELVRVPARIVELLSYAEACGADAVCSALDAWGIGYQRVNGGHQQ